MRKSDRSDSDSCDLRMTLIVGVCVCLLVEPCIYLVGARSRVTFHKL